MSIGRWVGFGGWMGLGGRSVGVVAGMVGALGGCINNLNRAGWTRSIPIPIRDLRQRCVEKLLSNPSGLITSIA